MEHAVLEVTEAVLGQDGACLPGRETRRDFVEVCVCFHLWCKSETFFIRVRGGSKGMGWDWDLGRDSIWLGSEVIVLWHRDL